MQARWLGKNVDLSLLSGHIEDFLRGKGFKTRKDESAEGYTISGMPQRAHGIYGKVVVEILGSSNDFVIGFWASEHTRSAIKAGLITTMFGGGHLLLRGLKSQEALERLEKEFWRCIEETIPYLINLKKHT